MSFFPSTTYTRQKKKLLAFSFANFKITGWSTGKQWGWLEYPTNKNETLAIPVLPLVVSKFANEKARSLFYE